jgi:3-hydroxyacyl-[acyl-carrier-protein] dehydratase
MRRAGFFCVPADHPSLPGHFPGYPVVPGVVLLDMAFDLIVAQLPGMTLAGFAAVKFIASIQPDREVEVRYHPPTGARLGFACVCDGAISVQGTALLQSQS